MPAPPVPVLPFWMPREGKRSAILERKVERKFVFKTELFFARNGRPPQVYASELLQHATEKHPTQLPLGSATVSTLFFKYKVGGEESPRRSLTRFTRLSPSGRVFMVHVRHAPEEEEEEEEGGGLLAWVLLLHEGVGDTPDPDLRLGQPAGEGRGRRSTVVQQYTGPVNGPEEALGAGAGAGAGGPGASSSAGGTRRGRPRRRAEGSTSNLRL